MLLLKGGRVLCPSTGVDELLDVRIQGGVVVELGADLSTAGADLIDCSGAVVMPAFVDLVADLADPGQTWREDLASGSRAAAAGGFGTVLVAPLTHPVVDSAAVACGLVDACADAPGARVLRSAALTLGGAGSELAEMGTMLDDGCVALSDGGQTVADVAVLRNALSYARPFGAPVLLRPGVPALEQDGCMHEGDVSLLIGLRGIPAASEEIGIATVIALVRDTGARTHLSHVTTALGVELVAQAKRSGLPITASVPARSLLLTDSAVMDSGYDTSVALLPPLRPEPDRLALCRAVSEGIIDCVCSDHSPWSQVEKDVEFERAQPGAVGLETAFAATLTALDGDLVATCLALAVRPAAVLGRTARVAVGQVADLVVVDPRQRAVCALPQWSKSRNEPLVGWSLIGVVHTTIVGGRVVAPLSR